MESNGRIRIVQVRYEAWCLRKQIDCVLNDVLDTDSSSSLLDPHFTRLNQLKCLKPTFIAKSLSREIGRSGIKSGLFE